MKIFYLTMAPIEESSGVYKKIRAQVNAFERLGHNCKLLFVRDSENAFFYPGNGQKQEKLVLRNKKHIGYISEYLLSCNFCYARFELLRHKYYKNIIDICRRGKIPIITEIPTYPPYQESLARVKEYLNQKEYLRALKTLLGTSLVIIDMYRMSLYSKMVVIIADDKKFRFTKTVRIENGVDLEKNPYQPKNRANDRIRMIAVSNFSIWNGYDRVLNGLKQYIDLKSNFEVKLIMVGGLIEAQPLIKQTEKLGLSNNVTFTGALSGSKLDEAYANADIAIAALGNHRRKVYANSSLKVKEYASRGMLMILSDAEGIETEIKSQSFIVKSDESPLDINAIVNWYHSINDKDSIRLSIHNFAKENYSWDSQIQVIIDEIQNEK